MAGAKNSDARDLSRAATAAFVRCGSEGCGPFYASIRSIILKGLVDVGKSDAKCPGFLWQALGPALLGMDTLECYSRIFAEAAEQLRPTAALQLTTGIQGSGSAGAPAASQPQASDAAAEPSEEQQTEQQVRQADQMKQQGGQKRQGHWAETPSLEDVEELIREPIALFAVLGMAVNGLQHAPAGKPSSGSQASGESAGGNRRTGRDSGSDDGGDDGNSSSGGGAGGSRGSSGGGVGSGSGSDNGGSGRARSTFPKARSMLTWTADKLQSSYVLEHWSRLLLLGTSAAVVRGGSTQQRAAQALQARSLSTMSLSKP